MTGVLRLIRINLFLHLVPAVLSYFALMFGADQGRVMWVSIALLPTLFVLGISFLLERRNRITPATIRALLILALITTVLEFALGSALLLVAAKNNFLPAEVLNRIQAERGFPNIGPSFLFSLVPCMLGVWLDGRRGVIRWALMCVALYIVGLLLVVGVDRLLATNLMAVRGQLAILVAFAIVTSVVCFFVGALADQQREEHAQLEAANKRLAEQAYIREQLAANQERMQISRDLHDTVAHTLAALAVQISAVNAVIAGDEADARRELEKASTLVREGLDNTRRAIGDLRTNQVEDFGLDGALQKLTDSYHQRMGIVVDYQSDGDLSVLNPQIANTLYRITQESLNNIERHAQANHIQVQVTVNALEGQFTCRINDDGIGFDQRLLNDERFGIRGMRERAEIIGAHLRVDSALRKGTTIWLHGQAMGLVGLSLKAIDANVAR